MSDKQEIERLVRIEEGVKSLGKSMDLLREQFETHATRSDGRHDAVESKFDAASGGVRVFLAMSGVLALITGGIWAVVTWVTKSGGT